MRRFLNKFFNLKLRVKLFISFLIIIFISTILVNYFTYKLYEADAESKSVLFSQNLVSQIASNISYRAKSLDDTIFLNIKVAEIFSETAASNEFLYVIRSSSVPALINSISNTDVEVREIFLENISNENFYYNKENPSRNDYKNTNIYQYIRKNQKMIRDKWGQSIWTTFRNDKDVIYIFRAVIDQNTLQYKGIVGVGIDSKYFTELYSGFNQASEGSIVIYNGNQDIMYCNENMLPAAEHFKSYIPKASGDSIRYHEFNHGRYLITGSISNNERWKVLYIVSSEALVKDSDKIRFRIIMICLISVILALAVAIVISGSITSNIRLLLKKIRSVGQGNFSLQLEPTCHDEVGELFVEFNIMSDKLKELIDKIAFEQVEKRKAEYSALQAQINPHFLYNALESINSFAKINGQEDIVRIIHSLSYLLRASISDSKSVVKLSDELDYVRNYLSIQKMILGDRITVDYDIDENVLDCEVPKLILQPIVENAIVHGIEGMRQGGLIIISANSEAGLLCIKVSDNGAGMEADMVRKLLEESGSGVGRSSKYTHIGIRSVNKRVRILYGNEYGLSISSEPDIGTVVTISIPLKHENGGPIQ